MPDLTDTAIQKLLDTGGALSDGQERVFLVDGHPLALAPSNLELHDLGKYLDAPLRIDSELRFDRVDSFCDYVSRFHDDSTVIFYESGLDGGTMVAVLDYHMRQKPARCSHRARLAIPFTDTWIAWEKRNGSVLSQQDFGEFLDDNQSSLGEGAAALISAALAFRAKKIINFEASHRLDNGQVQFQYVEEIRQQKGAGAIELPEQFLVNTPVFEEQQPMTLIAKLRYRIQRRQDGQGADLKLGYKLHDPRGVQSNAVKALVESVRANLPEQPFFAGSLV